MYRLAVHHLYPEALKRQTEFVLLQFDESEGGIVRTPDVSDAELEGFKHFLTDIQRTVDNFSIEDAKSGFAADKGYLTKYEGFGGLTQCGVFGRISSDSPHAKKKDGSKMWACECKFAYFYWVLLDEDDKIIDSQINSFDLKVKSEGQRIEKRFYEGCPKFQHLQWNRDMNKRAKKELDK